MIIGFVLLVSACGTGFCDALPVTDDIYLNRESCQLVMDIVHERRPNAVLICGEVWRGNSDEQNPAN
ncbi:hypothetical protein PCO82_09240 [Pectobacteriaceae bacterium CE90]|nr:hypothetical protein [Prodigiosinella sp. LS101]WJV52781.1 hypothetical protein PCO85_16370 [Prodigiosinella sp. LS101]WJV57135.1 hypothetical protein PCO84_16350 [Pectobacteriaceae bacterium C111]WJY16786.1 hypothetical protein PCO82_09240 [Pectobacteriaceae bacterium CE90]